MRNSRAVLVKLAERESFSQSPLSTNLTEFIYVLGARKTTEPT